MTMASPLAGRPLTCLACVRRIASASSSVAHAAGSTPFGLTQVRGKKSSGRLKSQGVVVRLLQDVPQYGRAGAILRAPAGRMRNHFFCPGKAEYMTRERFAELGLTKADIGERDYTFQLHVDKVEYVFDDAVEAVAFGRNAIEAPANMRPKTEAQAKAQADVAVAQAFELDQISPAHALELLQALIPETITFERHLVHIPFSRKQPAASAVAPEPAEPESKSKAELEEKTVESEPEKPAPALTPLQAHRAMLRAEAEKAEREQKAAEERARQERQAERERAAAERARREEEERVARMSPEERERERKQKEKEAEELRKIHGSVTPQNIAAVIKEKLLADSEGSRIHVQPNEISFIGLEEGVDKLDKIGKYEVEIRAHAGKLRVPPIRRTIEIVPF